LKPMSAREKSDACNGKGRRRAIGCSSRGPPPWLGWVPCAMAAVASLGVVEFPGTLSLVEHGGATEPRPPTTKAPAAPRGLARGEATYGHVCGRLRYCGHGVHCRRHPHQSV